MKSITVIGPNLPSGVNPNGGDFVAHRTDCRDATKLMQHYDVGPHGGWDIEAATREEVAEAIYGDHMGEGTCTMEDAINDIYFLPCCGL